MPGGDQTGPLGMGSRTGRGAGFCAGYNVPGYMNAGIGYGQRMGSGFHRGFGHRGRGRGFMRGPVGTFWGSPYGPIPGAGTYAVPQVMTRENEIELLREQADHFKAVLENITIRLDELSKKDTKEGG